MTPITGTYQTFTAIGLREDLADVIWDISPTDTPVITNGGRGSAAAVLHEWQTDILDAPATNAHVQGDDTTFPTINPTVRVANFTQILKKPIIIADTLEAVDKAGRNSELAYQLMRKGKEILRDLETAVLENTPGDPGDATTTPAEFASMMSWLKTNTDFDATTGLDPVYVSGVPLTGRVDSSATRTLTEAIFLTVAQEMYTAGAEMRMVIAPPGQKVVISGFAGIATKQVQINESSRSQTVIIGAADAYVTDWGDLTIVPDRFARARDVFFLDPDFYSMRFLRTLKQVALAKSGDAEKRHLIMEVTLRVENEAAHGGIYDLT